MLYKGTRVTIIKILRQEDKLLEPVYKIADRLGKIKGVNIQDIVLDLLVIPLDISFATKNSGGNLY